MIQQGFIALTAVLTLSVIALMVTITGARVGLSALIHATTKSHAAHACMRAEGCTESVLYTFASDLDPPITGDVPLDDSECTIRSVTELETGVYLVTTEGTAHTIRCEIQMEVDTRGERIAVSAWNREYTEPPP